MSTKQKLPSWLADAEDVQPEQLAAPAAPAADMPDWLANAEDVPSKTAQLATGAQGVARDIAEGGVDLGLGAAQGITLGGADELEGGVRALGAKLSGEDADLVELYRQYQELSEKKYKQAEERSPWLYGAGNIAGGVALAPLTGGAGLAAAGTRVAVKEAMKQGGKMAAAKALGKAALKDALVAAPAAGVYGSLASEHDVIGASGEEKMKNLEDSLVSAGLGGTISGTMGLAANLAPVAAESAKKAKDSLLEGPLARLVKSAYRKGEEGINLGNENLRNKLFAESGDFADELSGIIGKGDDAMGAAVGQSIEDATAKGVTVDISRAFDDVDLAQILDDNAGLKFDPKIKKALQAIVSNENQTVTPNQARAIKDQMNKILGLLEGDNSFLANSTRDTVAKFNRGVDNALKNAIPEYRDAAQKFAQFRQSTSEQIMAGSTPAEKSGIMFGKTKKAEQKLRDAIEDLVHGATKEGSGGQGTSKAAWHRVQEKLLQLEKNNPEAFARMGTDAKSLIQKIKTASDDSALIQTYSQQNPRSSIPKNPQDVLTSFGGSANSKLLGFANKMGYWKVPEKVGAAATALPKLTKKVLFDMPLDGLAAVATPFAESTNPQAKKYGEALLRAINNKDQVAKNATLFAIMQNPNLRQMLNLEEEDSK
jgi:hypothetical protein